MILRRGRIYSGLWGKKWTFHFSKFPELVKVRVKGLSYVRLGMVYNLVVDKGHISAIVLDEDGPHEVRIAIKPLSREQWQAIKEKCTGIPSHSDLMAGRYPRSALCALHDSKSGIFPTRYEVFAKCDCGKAIHMPCGHMAAVLSAMAPLVDLDPELAFSLRGVRSWDLLPETPESPEDAADRPQGRPPGPAFGPLVPAVGPVHVTCHEASHDPPAPPQRPAPGPAHEAAPGRPSRKPGRGPSTELPKAQSAFAPPMAMRIKPAAAPAPVIVRRRNGQESRVFLGDPPPPPAPPQPEPALGPEPPVADILEDAPEFPPKRKRAYRPRRARRAKGKWVSIDVDSIYSSPDRESGKGDHPGAPANAAPSLPGAQPQAGDGAAGAAAPPAKARGAQKRPLPAISEEDLKNRRAKGLAVLKGVFGQPVASRATRGPRAKNRATQGRALAAAPKGAASAGPTRIRKTMKANTQKTYTRPTAGKAKAVTAKAVNSKAVKTAKRKGAMPLIDFAKVTGRSIKAFRRHLGLSIESFALQLDMCVATVRRWEETGGRLALHSPSLEALRKIYRKQQRKEAREA
ncbi:MAG: hypothetical protein LBF40_02570 [Deltaproteobacteria bacterium]|nr:hypothetical protein [Deltaproteobacteria bacterium]